MGVDDAVHYISQTAPSNGHGKLAECSDANTHGLRPKSAMNGEAHGAMRQFLPPFFGFNLVPQAWAITFPLSSDFLLARLALISVSFLMECAELDTD